MKKLVSLLLAIVMLLSVGAAFAEESGLPLEGRVVILHTNDVHGGAMTTSSRLGYAGIKVAKENLEALGAKVYLMDAGDAMQGEPIVNIGYGTNAVDFMNLTGYTVACPGNHEFDWGVDNLIGNLKLAEYPFICANILDAETGKTKFDPNYIIEVEDGVKIGVFALDTPEVATKTHPDKTKGLKILAEEELYACAQAQADELRAAGCQLVVCLGHLGDEDESAPNRSIDLLDKVTGIDLFIDGHSHTLLQSGDVTHGGTLRVSAGTKSEYLGYVVYQLKTNEEDGTISFEASDVGVYGPSDLTKLLMAGINELPVDAELDSYIYGINEGINTILDMPFAKTEVVLNGERDPGNRTEETNLGDFATDAILWAAKKSYGDSVVAALTNGGGIRATVEAGDISMLDLKTVFPFGNSVAVLTLKGSELLEALEAATCSTPKAIGAFPQVSGIEYEINTAVEWVNGEQYPNSTYYAPANPGARVTIKTVGGEAFDPEKSYTIATNDFTAAGGDTYYVFRTPYQTNGVNTGLAMEDALVNYVTEVLDGVIGQQYAAPQGRIIVK